MIKGSEVRHADHPIDALFIDRWSPRAMSGEEIAEEELLTLFEAARWAPSSNNNQPWRVLYARRSTEHWPLFLSLLVETNQVWAKNAAALLVFISKTTFDHNGKPSITHSFDTGARTALGILEDFQVEAMVAIGRPGDKASLPEALQNIESPNSRRKVSSSVCEGPFRF
jgi:nitroreductase